MKLFRIGKAEVREDFVDGVLDLGDFMAIVFWHFES